MKEIIKEIWIAILGLIICLLILFYMAHEYDDSKLQYDSLIGSEIVFNSDTLIIIKASFYDETYTLNDGREISYKLLKTL